MRLLLITIVTWLALSGIFIPLLLALGLVSSLLVVWLVRRADRKDGDPIVFSMHLWRLPGYFLWLAVEVVKSNIDVARCILSPNLSIAPAIRWLPAKQRTELGRVLYANSITLTPGTLSIDLDDGAVEVHAVDEAALELLASGEMADRICALEKDAKR
ncbi:Na+/H+ antiporter subunit E [Thioalkalivibrio sp. HK1]|uniref:Na+/H+ antiporter subunit E n=1 Tax=Thioalkalivibrio sp. HK1 TaxID=1469245 RepID=UPI000471890E|nr:Na+/H+ antiporter subunit E [Thioalkalivibrio sp. HK1]